jgi:hypothetical protein
MVKVISPSDGHGLADSGEGNDHDPKKGQESERYDEGVTANGPLKDQKWIAPKIPWSTLFPFYFQHCIGCCVHALLHAIGDKVSVQDCHPIYISS